MKLKSIAILSILLTYHISIRVLHCLYIHVDYYIENLTLVEHFIYPSTHLATQSYPSPSTTGVPLLIQKHQIIKTKPTKHHVIYSSQKKKKSQGQDCGPHYPSSNRLRSNYSKKQNK